MVSFHMSKDHILMIKKILLFLLNFLFFFYYRYDNLIIGMIKSLKHFFIQYLCRLERLLNSSVTISIIFSKLIARLNSHFDFLLWIHCFALFEIIDIIWFNTLESFSYCINPLWFLILFFFFYLHHNFLETIWI